jgi:hypothetical protein
MRVLAICFCLALTLTCAACVRPSSALFPFEYGVSGGAQAPHRDLDQVWYCGPNGPAIAERQRSEGKLPANAQNLDYLCGRSLIVLHRAEGKVFPETRPTSVEIFKSTNYFGTEPPKVLKDKAPTKQYVVVGTFEFPVRWYYYSTIDQYLAESVGKLGGDAVLEYDTYQDAAGVAIDQLTGERHQVFHMYMKGTAIKFVGN